MTEAILKIRKNIKVEQLNIFAILAAAALIVIYLFVANNVAMANYRKVSLQKHVDGLRIEIRTLNLELADKRSISFLKKAAQGLNLVVNENIQYIKISGPVAKQ